MTMLQCTDPAQISDTDYMSYLDGYERPDFVQHLKNCAFCRNEVSAYAAYDLKLHAQLKPIKAATRANCPDSQLLGEYVLDVLKKSARQELENHLTQCEFCSHEYAQLNGWLLEPQPGTQTQKVENTDTIAQLLKRVVATVLTVARPMPLQMSLRGTARPIPLTYEADGVIINVAVQKAGTSHNDLQVVGQVMGEDEEAELDTTGAEARLIHSGAVVATEVVDEIGGFFFNQVKATDFDLEIQLKDRIIVVPNLH